jgi:hypothetical protein
MYARKFIQKTPPPDVLFDMYVRPDEPVTDYRTWVSGVSKDTYRKNKSLSRVQAIKKAEMMLANRTVIGHSIENDWAVRNLIYDFFPTTFRAVVHSRISFEEVKLSILCIQVQDTIVCIIGSSIVL